MQPTVRWIKFRTCAAQSLATPASMGSRSRACQQRLYDHLLGARDVLSECGGAHGQPRISASHLESGTERTRCGYLGHGMRGARRLHLAQSLGLSGHSSRSFQPGVNACVRGEERSELPGEGQAHECSCGCDWRYNKKERSMLVGNHVLAEN